jgi:choline transport protein
MSEEIKNATMNVPRSIIFSTLFNGVLALVMLIAFVICAGDITDAESSAPYPYIPIFARLVGQNAGATIMVCLIITLQFCSCIAATATASRLIWAFARDRGLPFWRQLSEVC